MYAHTYDSTCRACPHKTAIKSTVGKIVAVGPPLIQTVQAVPMQYTPVVQAQAAPIHFKDVQIVQVSRPSNNRFAAHVHKITMAYCPFCRWRLRV